MARYSAACSGAAGAFKNGMHNLLGRAGQDGPICPMGNYDEWDHEEAMIR